MGDAGNEPFSRTCEIALARDLCERDEHECDSEAEQNEEERESRAGRTSNYEPLGRGLSDLRAHLQRATLRSEVVSRVVAPVDVGL
jgi:hypothetical protein